MFNSKDFNIEDLLLIGKGTSANVYALDEKNVLKLYSAKCPENFVEYEVKVAQLAYALEIPTPLTIKKKVGKRTGIISDRIYGLTMEQTMRKSPWKLVEMAKLLAVLQAQIHSHAVPGLICFDKAKRKQIELSTCLSKKKKEILFNILDNLPKGNVFCHGDIHPNNIIITSNGAQVIDWSCAVSANPYIDIFKTVMKLPKYNEKPIKIFSLTKFFEHIYIKLFIRIYLSHYVRLTNSNMSEIKHWLTLKDLKTLFLLQ